MGDELQRGKQCLLNRPVHLGEHRGSEPCRVPVQEPLVVLAEIAEEYARRNRGHPAVGELGLRPECQRAHQQSAEKQQEKGDAEEHQEAVGACEPEVFEHPTQVHVCLDEVPIGQYGNKRQDGRYPHGFHHRRSQHHQEQQHYQSPVTRRKNLEKLLVGFPHQGSTPVPAARLVRRYATTKGRLP
jgi:hypothetical protein